MSNYTASRYSNKSQDLNPSPISTESSSNRCKERAVDDDDDFSHGTDRQSQSVLAKYIDRFRTAEPMSREKRLGTRGLNVPQIRPNVPQTQEEEFWWQQEKISSFSESDQSPFKRSDNQTSRKPPPPLRQDFSPPRRHLQSPIKGKKSIKYESIEELQKKADSLINRHQSEYRPTEARFQCDDEEDELDSCEGDNSAAFEALVKASSAQSKARRAVDIDSYPPKPPGDDISQPDAGIEGSSVDILAQWRIRRRMELARLHQDPVSSASRYQSVLVEAPSRMLMPQEVSDNHQKTPYHLGGTRPLMSENMKVVRVTDAETQMSPKLHPGSVAFTSASEPQHGHPHVSHHHELDSSLEAIVFPLQEHRQSHTRPSARLKHRQEEDVELSSKKHRKQKREKKKKSKHADKSRSSSESPKRQTSKSTSRGGNKEEIGVDLRSNRVSKQPQTVMESSTDFGSVTLSSLRESRDLMFKSPVNRTIGQAVISHLFDDTEAGVRSSAETDSFFGCLNPHISPSRDAKHRTTSPYTSDQSPAKPQVDQTSDQGRHKDTRRCKSPDLPHVTEALPRSRLHVSQDCGPSRDKVPTVVRVTNRNVSQDCGQSRDEVPIDAQVSNEKKGSDGEQGALLKCKEVTDEVTDEVNPESAFDHQSSFDVNDILNFESDSEYPEDQLLRDLRAKRDHCLEAIRQLNICISEREVDASSKSQT